MAEKKKIGSKGFKVVISLILVCALGLFLYSRQEDTTFEDEVNDYLAKRKVAIEALIKELRPKANSGDIDSQAHLGKLLLERGKPGDEEEGAKWSIKAVENSNSDDFNFVANLYQCGIGVERNLKKAAHWYLKSANKGDVIAQYKIWWMYKEGKGVKQDSAKAKYWKIKVDEAQRKCPHCDFPPAECS